MGTPDYSQLVRSTGDILTLVTGMGSERILVRLSPNLWGLH